MTPRRVGLIGTGNISGQYLATIGGLSALELVAVSDRDLVVAAAAARRFGLDAEVLSPEALLARDDIDIVLNLTVPAAHVEVSLAAVDAGKHVYVEKPIALELDEAARLLLRAGEQGVLVGVAPDTVLGTGIQTARAVVEAGSIGRPIAATAFMTTPGHERWHPNPDFYYAVGGGPLLDMGPYYLTALHQLLGPVARVVAMTSRSRPTRTIATGPRAGQSVPVEVATHETALLEHVGGAVSTILLSFDVWESTLPRIEVYGTDGTLSVPDPNGFGGDVRVATAADREWRTVSPLAGFVDAGRGVGLSDLAHAASIGGTPRTDGKVAFHVLEIIDAITRSAASGQAIDIVSSPERTRSVPLGGTPGAD